MPRGLSRNQFVTLYEYDPAEGPRSALRTAAERAVNRWATAPTAQSLPLALAAEEAILAGGSAAWVKQMKTILAALQRSKSQSTVAARDNLAMSVAMAENLFRIPKTVLERAKRTLEADVQTYLATGADPHGSEVARAAALLHEIDAHLASAKTNPRRRRSVRRRR